MADWDIKNSDWCHCCSGLKYGSCCRHREPPEKKRSKMNPMCTACGNNPATNDQLKEGEEPLCRTCRGELREVTTPSTLSNTPSREHSQQETQSGSKQRFDE